MKPRAEGGADSPFIFLVHAYLEVGYEYEVYLRADHRRCLGLVKPVRGGWAYQLDTPDATWQFGPKTREEAGLALCAAAGVSTEEGKR